MTLIIDQKVQTNTGMKTKTYVRLIVPQKCQADTVRKVHNRQTVRILANISTHLRDKILKVSTGSSARRIYHSTLRLTISHILQTSRVIITFNKDQTVCAIFATTLPHLTYDADQKLKFSLMSKQVMQEISIVFNSTLTA